MKKSIFILSFVFLTSSLFSQNFEWEILNTGLAFGFSKDKDEFYNENGGAMTFGSELRYNLRESHFSPGLQVTFSGWNKISDEDKPSYHQNAFVFLITTDCNYTEMHPKFTPFAGIGAGTALMREWELFSNHDINFKSHFAISPRIGFEFFKRLRFTTEYMHLGNGNNFFNFKLGFVVGF